MTQDEIYEKLGLQDPDHFKLEAHWRMCDLHFAGKVPESEVFTRRWGKTTRQIVACLEHLSNNPDEPVLLVHQSKALAEYMLKRAQEWAYQLGLPSHRIQPYVAHNAPRPRGSVVGYYDCQVFCDPDVI